MEQSDEFPVSGGGEQSFITGEGVKKTSLDSGIGHDSRNPSTQLPFLPTLTPAPFEFTAGERESQAQLDMYYEFLESHKQKCFKVNCTRDDEENPSVAIDRFLKKQKRKESRKVKLLLLGIGESGKTTVTKQMQILHLKSTFFNTKKRIEWTEPIHKNVKDAILTLLGAMEHLNVTFEREDNTAVANELTQAYSEHVGLLPKTFFDLAKLLWADHGVRTCYDRASEFQIIDSAKYFLDRLGDISASDYIPSEQDILRCRVITTSIRELNYTVEDGFEKSEFAVFDVGGQRGERRKWLQLFDCLTSVLFVVDIAGFDVALQEDHSKNRLAEAIEIFHQTWNNRYLKRVSVIVFMNKIDLLRERIAAGRSLARLEKFSISVGDVDNLLEWQIPQDYIDYIPSDKEQKEFLTKYYTMIGITPDPLKSDIDYEFSKTACFVKDIFKTITAQRRTVSKAESRLLYEVSGSNWHQDHYFESYFTCAVDTEQIGHVLEACRSFIIMEILKRTGIR